MFSMGQEYTPLSMTYCIVHPVLISSPNRIGILVDVAVEQAPVAVALITVSPCVGSGLVMIC